MDIVSRSNIDYPFEEKPSWRKVRLPKITEMIKEITQWRNSFADPSALVQRIIDRHAETAALEYVHNLNKGEMVGTQTLEDTQEVIDGLKSEPDERQGKSKEFIETMNNYNAMDHLFELHDDEGIEIRGSISVQQVNNTHKILLEDIEECRGEIRKKNVWTTWNFKYHDYPPHEVVEAKFYALIDHYNICIESVGQLDVESEEYTAGVFKCAARLMFDFVDTHPSVDGNGRMCRLLANYVLRLITPFPVAIYRSDESRSARGDYVSAIVRCRDYPEEGPCALAAMQVEGAWYGWKKLIAFVKNSTEVSMVNKKSSVQKGRVYFQ